MWELSRGEGQWLGRGQPGLSLHRASYSDELEDLLALHVLNTLNALAHLVLTPKRKVVLLSPCSDEELRCKKVRCLTKVANLSSGAVMLTPDRQGSRARILEPTHCSVSTKVSGTELCVCKGATEIFPKPSLHLGSKSSAVFFSLSWLPAFSLASQPSSRQGECKWITGWKKEGLS